MPGQSQAKSPVKTTANGSFGSVKAAALPAVQYTVDPIFNPVGGTYTTAKTIQIKSTTSGSVVHYTTDGSTPTEASPVLGTLKLSSGTTTVSAIAVTSGMGDSRVVQCTYYFQPAVPGGTVGAPAFSPVQGTYFSNINIKIKSQTTGAKIYYTTDGSAPTTSSKVYSTAIPLAPGSAMTINAFSFKAGLTSSPIIITDIHGNGNSHRPGYYADRQPYLEIYKHRKRYFRSEYLLFAGRVNADGILDIL